MSVYTLNTSTNQAKSSLVRNILKSGGQFFTPQPSIYPLPRLCLSSVLDTERCRVSFVTNGIVTGMIFVSYNFLSVILYFSYMYIRRPIRIWPILVESWCLFGVRLNMMTSSNGNIFRVTGHLCGEFTSHRWIPRTKSSDAELWCFLWSVPEYTVE